MKKKIILAVLVLLLFALAVPAVATVTGDQQKAINDLNKQILDLRKQVIDKYVESGQLTANQGKIIKDQLTAGYETRAKAGLTPGAGNDYSGKSGRGGSNGICPGGGGLCPGSGVCPRSSLGSSINPGNT